MTFASFYEVLDLVLSGKLRLYMNGPSNDKEDIALQKMSDESKGFWFLQD